MSNIYLSKEELLWFVNELPDYIHDSGLDCSEYTNIWKKAHDKLEMLECSKEMKQINKLESEIKKIKLSINEKRSRWGIK